MSKIDVRILNENWVRDLQEAAMNTVNKKYDSAKEFTPELFRKYLISEHSPIRCVTVRITMTDIPYPTSVHFARHVHSNHFVTTSRPDRVGEERSMERLVTHIMDCNLQSLIDLSRKRLCVGKVEKDTFKIMQEIKDYLYYNRDSFLQVLGEQLVPNCLYRNGCPEFKSCGYFENFKKITNDK